MKRFYIIILIIFIILILFFFTILIIGHKVNVKTEKKLDGVSDELCDVLYYASLAPNSHNAQMWKISINPIKHKVIVKLDKNRELLEVDRDNREAYISIGAYTENFLTALKAYGYSYDYNITEDNNKLVTITYDKNLDNILNDTLLNNISKRHTDKSAFNSIPIDNSSVNILTKLENIYYFNNNSNEFDYIKTNMLEATKQQSYNPSKATELSNWLRLSNSETIANKDGLSAEQLGLTGIKKALYYLTTTHESAKGNTFANQSISTAKNQLDNCSGFLVITGSNNTKELIETGIVLEKVWLNAVDLGISIQPMSQILEEDPYKAEISKKLNLDNNVQMILRIGYVDSYGKNSNIRRDLSEYVTIER